MLPDRLWNLGPLTYESGALRIALRGPAIYLSGNVSHVRPQTDIFSHLLKMEMTLTLENLIYMQMTMFS